MKSRKLKVRAGHYDRPHIDRIGYKPSPQVPFVLLKGQWLEQTFLIGRNINVECARIN